MDGLQLKQCQLGLLPCRVQSCSSSVLCRWGLAGDSRVHTHTELVDLQHRITLTRGPRDCRSAHPQWQAQRAGRKRYPNKPRRAQDTLLTRWLCPKHPAFNFLASVGHARCSGGRGTVQGGSENLGLIQYQQKFLQNHQPPVGYSPIMGWGACYKWGEKSVTFAAFSPLPWMHAL